jgi:hypothetical protein
VGDAQIGGYYRGFAIFRVITELLLHEFIRTPFMHGGETKLKDDSELIGI